MTLNQVFDRLEHVEQFAADLYSHYAVVFAEVGAARDLFLKMKKEELNHRGQVQLQKRILSSSHGASEAIEVDLSAVDKLISNVKAQMTVSGQTVLDAIDFAISLESGAMESTYRTAVAKHHPELKRLVGMLTAGDEHHLQQLRALRSHLTR